MVQPLNTQRETASQTAGPYVHIGCIPTFTGITSIYPGDLGTSPISTGAKGSGSAFFVEDDALITDAHVVQDFPMTGVLQLVVGRTCNDFHICEAFDCVVIENCTKCIW